MNTPRLSICIATRNRGMYLGETLDTIISQMSDDVELVIVDGASTDNTKSVVETYQHKCANLHYHRLEKNGGVDEDYSETVTLAQGEYCWLMTDDDLLKPGAVAAVLDAIEKRYVLIIVNAEVRSPDFSIVLEPTRLQLTQDKSYSPTELEDVFTDAALYMSFIGCVVIKRDLWMQREKEKYFGSCFIHMGVIFQTPLPGSVLAIAHPWIVIRYGNAMWTSRAMEIWMIRWRHLIWSLPLSKEARQKIAPISALRDIKELLLYRANGVYTSQYYRQLIENQDDQGVGFKIAAKTITYLPVYPLNLFTTLIYRALKNGKREMLLVDLANARKNLRSSEHKPYFR